MFVDIYPSSKSFRKVQDTSELLRWFKPFNMIQVPYEDDIDDIWYNGNIPYSERKEWLNNLYLITTKGFFIKVSDIIGHNYEKTNWFSLDGQPYSAFLYGVIISAYIYAYNTTPQSTLEYIYNNLQLGKITITKYVRGEKIGEFHFSFCNHGYSYISHNN